jgi:hypothetical protein
MADDLTDKKRYLQGLISRLDDSDSDWPYILDYQKHSRPHIPTFAHFVLTQLATAGLLYEPGSGLSYENARTVKLNDKQALLLTFDTYRDWSTGYMTIDVEDMPRSDTAILAAMTVMGAEPIDLGRLRKVLQYIEAPFKNTFKEHHKEALSQTLKEVKQALNKILSQEPVGPYPEFAWDLHHVSNSIEYVLALIRHYRPEFDSYSPQEQLDFIETTAKETNRFLEASRRFRNFLEYGAPNRNLKSPVENPQRDVRAAVLADVDQLKYPEIGSRLHISPPPAYADDGDYQSVSDAVKRGRDILEKAFGTEGCQQRVEKMRIEKDWWQSLSGQAQGDEQYIDWLARHDDISREEARRRFDNLRP